MNNRSRKFTRSTVATVEAPTTNLYLTDIINSTPCREHGASRTVPCYEYPSLINPPSGRHGTGGSWHYGICNQRALNHGMVGKISPSSLDRSLARPRPSRD